MTSMDSRGQGKAWLSVCHLARLPAKRGTEPYAARGGLLSGAVPGAQVSVPVPLPSLFRRGVVEDGFTQFFVIIRGICRVFGSTSSTPPEPKRPVAGPVEVMSMMAPVQDPSATLWPALGLITPLVAGL